MFVLEKNTDTNDRCYSTAFFTPLLLPFYSRYDDYGGGENSTGEGLQYIIKGLREKLVEFDVGANRCHDIEVKRDAFDEKKFFEAVQENRLKIKTYEGLVDIDFVMFRKDVVDDILINWIREKYVGEGKGTTGWGNNYILYNFADVVADMPEYLDKLETTLTRRGDLLGLHSSMNHLFDRNHPNKISEYMQHDTYRYSKIVRVQELLVKLMNEGNRRAAENILVDHLKAVHIDSFMHEVRKVWVPGSHEGSQAQEHTGYLVLMNAMTKALDSEREEEYEDD